MSSVSRLSRKLEEMQARIDRYRRKMKPILGKNRRPHGQRHVTSSARHRRRLPLDDSSDSSGEEEDSDSVVSSPLSSEVEDSQLDLEELSSAPVVEAPPADAAPLTQELLEALGSVPAPPQEFGQPLHPEVVTRWEDALKNGLEDSARQELLKGIRCPENLKTLAPPVVNPSVKSVLPSTAVTRDARLVNNQRQLGLAIAAIGSVVSTMLVEEGAPGIIAGLGVAGRILCDLHHDLSVTRKVLLSKHMRKDAQKPLLSAPLDGLLFGDDLENRLKAHKELEKIGKELKPVKPSTSHDRDPLNFRGPARRNQGARVGQLYQKSASIRQTFNRPKESRYRSKGSTGSKVRGSGRRSHPRQQQHSRQTHRN